MQRAIGTMKQRRAVYALGRSCMACCWGARPPSVNYVERGARLLFGTAMVESAGLRWDRQRGFDLERITGAWSWWQLEWGSVETSINRLERKPDLAQRCAQWLCQRNDADPRWYAGVDALTMMRWARVWPRLAVLLARLHYLRDPHAIPHAILDQARYWKDVYNTELGKGTVSGYLGAWCRWGAPVLESNRRM